MPPDITWDHFDRLVESYAAASAYVSSLQELEARIGQACAALLTLRAGIGALTPPPPPRRPPPPPPPPRRKQRRSPPQSRLGVSTHLRPPRLVRRAEGRP